MHKVFIGIGSNINKENNIVSCIMMLRRIFGEMTLSSIYESEAIGFKGDPFYNMVVAFDTDFTPQKIYTMLREVEHLHHRNRSKNKFISRTLDLDQLLYDDLVIKSSSFELPSDSISECMHVLFPLADIAGDLYHPILKKTCHELRNAFQLTQINTPIRIIPFETLSERMDLDVAVR